MAAARNMIARLVLPKAFSLSRLTYASDGLRVIRPWPTASIGSGPSGCAPYWYFPSPSPHCNLTVSWTTPLANLKITSIKEMRLAPPLSFFKGLTTCCVRRRAVILGVLPSAHIWHQRTSVSSPWGVSCMHLSASLRVLLPPGCAPMRCCSSRILTMAGRTTSGLLSCLNGLFEGLR